MDHLFNIRESGEGGLIAMVYFGVEKKFLAASNFDRKNVSGTWGEKIW